MAYVPDYTEGDLSSSIIDIIVKIIITVGIFATLIVLVFMFAFLKRKLK